MAKSLFGSIQRLGEDRYRVWWTQNGQRKSRVIHGTRDDAELFLATMRLSTSVVREENVPGSNMVALLRHGSQAHICLARAKDLL